MLMGEAARDEESAGARSEGSRAGEADGLGRDETWKRREEVGGSASPREEGDRRGFKLTGAVSDRLLRSDGAGALVVRG